MGKIQDVIEEIATNAAGDPYERTKERLLLLYAPSWWVMASHILHHPHLGDTRPSVLMSKMLALLPRGTLCFYHRKWGMAARYCRDPCSWQNRWPGNAPATGGL